MRPSIHPGEVLESEFLGEFGIYSYGLAKALNVPVSRVTRIVNCERGITADTALRLARFFDTTPEFWLNLQTHFDLEVAKRRDARRIDREVRPRTGSS